MRLPRDPQGWRGWGSLILRVLVTALLLAMVVALLIAILASRSSAYLTTSFNWKLNVTSTVGQRDQGTTEG